MSYRKDNSILSAVDMKKRRRVAPTPLQALRFYVVFILLPPYGCRRRSPQYSNRQATRL